MNINAAVLFLAIAIVPCFSQAPHQASIRLGPQVNFPQGLHLCNGAIINERYILTTADCMHSHVGYQVRPLASNMLIVEAGNIQRSGNQLLNIALGIEKIEINPSFDPATKENDLALIRLNSSLPLHTRQDVKWVELTQRGDYNRTCATSFYNTANFNSLFYPTQSIIVRDNYFCSHFTNVSNTKKQDICAAYMLSPNTMCTVTNETLKTTGDRGSPLICDNKLVGVLSMIIPPDPRVPLICAQARRFDALYTNIILYHQWVSSVIRNTPGVPIQPYPQYPMQTQQYPTNPPAPPYTTQTPPTTLGPQSHGKKNGAVQTIVSPILIILGVYFLSNHM